MTSLRIMTMNMATGSREAFVDFGAVTHADFINRVNPDVVMLQEVDRNTSRAGGVDQVAVLTNRTVLKNSHFVKSQNFQGGEYGVAIISRLPFSVIENRSLYQPAHWWPWLQTHRVVAPVAYARIETPEGPLHLYGTHFPLESSRQTFAAEALAATIPDGVATVLAGDFNTGRGNPELYSLDAKFTAAESSAAQVDEQDRGEGIDHIYLLGGMTCEMWSTVSPMQGAPAPLLRSRHRVRGPAYTRAAGAGSGTPNCGSAVSSAGGDARRSDGLGSRCDLGRSRGGGGAG